MRRAFGLALSLAALMLLSARAAQEAPPVPPPDVAEVPANPEPAAPAAREKAPPSKEVGRLIRVPLPITGNADTQVKRAVQKTLAELKPADSRPVLVFEFATIDNQSGQGSDFSRALALARYLSSRELSEVKTVAYIPQAVKGHAVLVAMACEEIIMAPEAAIGRAGQDEPAEEAIDPTVRSGYSEIANRRRTVPAAVALAMLDKNVEVLKVETEVSPEFVLRSELDELKKNHAIQNQQPLNRPGEFAQFTGREVARVGLREVPGRRSRRAWHVHCRCRPKCCADDPSLAGQWRPVRIPLKGPITPQLSQRTQRMIDDQIREQDANFVCLWIDSPGGSLQGSLDLANYLADLNPAKVRTVAFVPAEARADAAPDCHGLRSTGDDARRGAGRRSAVDLAPEEVLITRETVRDH